MSYSRIAQSILIFALVLSADAALASVGGSAGVSSTQPDAVRLLPILCTPFR